MVLHNGTTDAKIRLLFGLLQSDYHKMIMRLGGDNFLL